MAVAPATSLTVANADDALRIMYSDKRVKYLGYKDNPLLAILPKNEKFRGKSKEIPLWFGGNQGRSRTFSNAQGNKRPGKYDAFFLTRVKDYALGSVETEAVLASEGDDAAFIELWKGEVDGTIRTASNNLAMSVFRNIGGARGQVATGGIAALVVTLADPQSVVFFEIGQVIVNSTTDGTSGAVGTARMEVTAVNRRDGKVTFDNVTNLSALDYLFQEGDFGLSLAGLASWVPNAVPAATSFFGVDRTVDTRLYGQYLDASTLLIQEGFERADELVYREGGMLSHFIVNPKDFGTLRTSLGSKVIYDKVKSPDVASISFSTIVVKGMKGDIQVVPDRNCQAGTAWGLTLDSWELCTLGGGPKVLTGKDGLKFLWDYNADSMEIRVGMYGNLACHAPISNIQVKLT